MARGGLVGGVAVALMGVAGCGVTAGMVEAPESAPAFRIDEAASEVRLVNATDAARVRAIGKQALDAMVATRGGKPAPARFQAVVKGDVGTSGASIAFCTVPSALTIIGLLWMDNCPNGLVSVEVDLVLEVDGKSLRGSGSDSFSVDGDAGQDEWEALVHNAFQEAADEALSSGPSPSTEATNVGAAR